MPSQNPIKMRIQLQVICIQILKELLRPKNFGNLYQLIIIVMPMEERFLPENHACKHTPQAPHIQRIIILLQIHQQLRSLEVPTRHTDIVLPSRMIKLGQPPINQPQLPLLMINHDIVRLDIPMHHPIRMTIIQRLEQLKYIIPNIIIRQGRIQYLEIGIIHMLKNQRGGLGLWIPYHIQQLDNVGPPTHILKYFDFTFNLFFFDGLENFNDAFGVVADVDSLEYLGVFAPADFADDLVPFLIAPVDGEGLVVPVVAGAVDVDVCVDFGSAHDFIPSSTRLWRRSKLADERTEGGRCVAQDGAWLSD
mmetsp:Transcript_14032/g.21715  ORF Transcript_14032/g.21715 Transcript_14032/m.21715 type:complete len:307 (+) Transcript_14032:338-1258(+)